MFDNKIKLKGDELLYVIHRVTPFFNERSSFEFQINYKGGEDVTKVTYCSINALGTVSI
jgi:hypothetical protein